MRDNIERWIDDCSGNVFDPLDQAPERLWSQTECPGGFVLIDADEQCAAVASWATFRLERLRTALTCWFSAVSG